MTLGYTYDGSTASWKVAPTTLVIPSRAELGTINQGGLTIDDPGGTVTLTGWKTIAIEEDACSQPRLWTGYVKERTIGRSLERGQFMGATARIIEAGLVDLNALFYLRIIHGAGGKRPEETWRERLDWLCGSTFLDGLIVDNGFTADFSRVMQATDYRGQFPADVLNEMAARVATGLTPLNYFAFWDPVGAQVTLFFDFADVTTFDSTIFISNDPADVDDSTTFAPSSDAKLVVSPEDVYSEVRFGYKNGHIFASDPDTAAAFIERGTTFEREITSTETHARERAQDFLQNHADEQQTITVTVRLPATKVGLIQSGMRVKVKFTHLADYGFDSFTWVRCTSASPKPINDAEESEYDVQLELTTPRATGSGGSVGGDTTFTPPTATTLGTTLTITDPGDGGNSPTSVPVSTSWYAYVLEASFDDTSCPAGSSQNGFEIGKADNSFTNTSIFLEEASGGLAVRQSWSWLSPFLGGPTSVTTSSGRTLGPDQIGTGDEVGVFRQDSVTSTTFYGYKQFLSDTAVHITHHFDTLPMTASVRLLITTDDPATVWANGSDYYLPGGGGDAEPPNTGDLVTGDVVTPATDGSTTTFSVSYPYVAGSLHVWVDNLLEDDAVTATDPDAGTFTLGFAPAAGEQITVTYEAQ